jgi:DNA repair protein RadC
MKIASKNPQLESVFYEVAEVGLHYVRADLTSLLNPKISSSSDAARILRPFFSTCMQHHEQFSMLCLSNHNEVLAAYKVSDGGLTGTVADVRIIYQTALLCNATAIIICHNHPSGNTRPSQADITLTKKVKQAGEILDIKLLDHIILTADAYTSFGDEGLL